MTTAAWIAVDWGTSRLRVWAMGPDGGPDGGNDDAVLATASSDDGMGKLARDGFEPALLALVGDWLADGRVTPVVACGMVGARQGWVEAAYLTAPCPPLDAARMTLAPTRDPRLSVRIIPGVAQMTPADVMRGEETQVAGCLAADPAFDGVLCLPGTHTKWARVSAGELVSFQTFMTGEIFALMSDHSVLRHSLNQPGFDEAAFDAALSAAMAHPGRIAAQLFALRAESLLSGLGAAAARARLSAWLIGVELASARPYWLGQRLAIIGAGGLSATYARALAAQGARATVLDGDAMTLGGIIAAAQQLKDYPA